MTSKILTDGDGDTLYISPWPSGRVVLVARQVGKRAEFGPVEPADLITAIREAAGETTEPAGDLIPAPSNTTVPTADDFAKDEFARHPDGRIAARVDGDSPQWRASDMQWLSDTAMAAEGWQIVTPAPTTAREAVALAVSLAYEPEGDTMPDQNGHLAVRDDGAINVYSEGSPVGLPARGKTCRRLLLDPPATVTPEWHSARIVEATCRGRVCQWARTATDSLWVSLDGESREAYTPDLSDVTVVVPEEVEACWNSDEGQVTQASVRRADRVAITWDDHGGEVFMPADAEFIAAARTAIPALLDALDAAEAELAAERRVARAAWDVMDRHRCDEQAERAYRRAERAEAELDRLHSWAGLMELLDEHYPADLIPTAPDDPARDTGPRIVSLIRRVDAAEAAIERVRAQAQGWRDEYSDPVYRDNGWCQGVLSAATEVIRTLDGDA